MPPVLVVVLALLAAPLHADEGRRVLRAKDIEPSAAAEEAARQAEVHSHRAAEIQFAEELLRKSRELSQRSELTLRLAELYTDEARDLHLQEMAAHQRAVDACYDDPTCDPTQLEADHTESRAWREKAVALYRHVLDEDPSFQRADEARYFLADALRELEDPEGALREYTKLVKAYPDSEFVPDAFLLIGEHYFESGEAYKALLAYDRAAAFTDYPQRPFALYKLAWSQYNVGEYRDAIQSMQRVVSLSKDRGTVVGGVNLEEEALRDLVRFFADAGLTDEAREYYISLGREELARTMLERLADTYLEQGRTEEAVVMLRRLIAEDPGGAKAPALQSQVASALRRMGDDEAALESLLRLRKDYGPGSSWARQHAADREVLEEATRLYDEGLRAFATDMHDRARKLRAGPQAQEATRLAEAAYAAWLGDLSGSPRSYDMRYAYGELLYGMKRFEEAHEQYVAVVETDPKGKHSQFCAESAIFAAQELAKGETKPKVEGTEPVDLTRWEQAEMDDIARYVTHYPEAEPVRKMLYRSAWLLYERNHFKESSTRFRQVIAMEPGSAEAAQGGELILDSLALVEDWDTLVEVAGEFYAQPTLGDARFKQDVFEVYERASFKRVEALQDPAAAAEGYLAFVAEFPESEIGDKALHNAAVHLYGLERRPEAIAAREALLARYPESEHRLDTIAALGYAYEEQAEFDRAAALYEQLFQEDPEHEAARAAIYSAALFRRAGGDWGQAVKDYQGFLAAWPEDIKSPLIRMDIASLYEENEAWDLAANVYREAWTGPEAARYDGDQLAWMRLRYGRCLSAQGQEDAAMAHYAQSVGWIVDAEADGVEFTEGRAALAEMMFLQIEADFEAFLTLRVEGPKVPVSRSQEDRLLAKQLTTKLDALRDLKERYTEVVNVAGGEYSVRAAVRLGELFDDMAVTFAESHVPTYLTPEQREFYLMNVNDRVWQQEELAVEYYSFAVEAGHAALFYEGPVVFASERMSALRPMDFPPLEEELLEPEYLDSAQRTRALEMLDGPEVKVELEE